MLQVLKNGLDAKNKDNEISFVKGSRMSKDIIEELRKQQKKNTWSSSGRSGKRPEATVTVNL